jgi:tRNA(Ile)-lysidine synthase TilS/MesJ
MGNDGKWYLTKVKKACKKYEMINDGDRIAVGISGGKDSSALLHIIKQLQRHLSEDFEVIPIYVDLGFGMEMLELEEFCRSLGYEMVTQKTQIQEIVFDVRKEKNPCSLCSKMRKGALVDKAKDLGCNKLALGHHLDDAAETFFLNLLYTGKLASFAPIQYLDRRDITMIRPMAYLAEQTIQSMVNAKGLPQVKNKCPIDGSTKREEMKAFLAGIEEQYPDFKDRFKSSMENIDKSGIWALLGEER